MLTSRSASEQFGEIVMPHLADALALARWLTGNSDDAEDVVQEACLRAYNGIGTYGGGNARAWLLAIVRNTSYSWLAKNRPRSLVVAGDLADLADLAGGRETESGPEAEVIARAEGAALEAAISRLPAPFREALVLRDINGLSYREIAAMLDVPLGTVMSRLARARGLLASMLGSDQ